MSQSTRLGGCPTIVLHSVDQRYGRQYTPALRPFGHEFSLKRGSHGRNTGRRRHSLPAGTGAGRIQAVALGQDAGDRPAYTGAHEGPSQLAGADAAGVGRRRGDHVAQSSQSEGVQGFPQDPGGDRRVQPGLHPDLGRRPVREFQRGHHTAVLCAGLRQHRVCALQEDSGQAEHLGRA